MKLFYLLIICTFLLSGCARNIANPIMSLDGDYYVWVKVPVVKTSSSNDESSNDDMSSAEDVYLTNGTSENLQIGPIFLKPNESTSLFSNEENLDFVKGKEFKEILQNKNLHIWQYEGIENILVIKK